MIALLACVASLAIPPVSWGTAAAASPGDPGRAGLHRAAPDRAEAGRRAPHRLGAGAELRVTVYREPDMSGEFAIDPSGTISVPGLGEIRAGGRTSGEVRDAVVGALRERDIVDPHVAVQVVEYGPVFVMGRVRSPGRFAYEPGMTVLQLVAIAGGYALPPEFADGAASVREQGNWRQEAGISRERLAALLMRRARLVAQRDDTIEIDPPDRLALLVDPERARRMHAVEAELLRLTLEEPRERIALIRDQRSNVEAEIEALGGQADASGKLQLVIDEELASSRALRERGLLPSSRILELERLSIDTALKRDSATVSLFRARQARTDLDLRVQEIEERLRTRTIEDLIEVETEIAVLDRRILALQELLVLSDAPIDGGAGAMPFEYGFAITRASDDPSGGAGEAAGEAAGGDLTVEATPTTPVRPGDVLSVERRAAASHGFPTDARGAGRDAGQDAELDAELEATLDASPTVGWLERADTLRADR